MIVQVVNAYAKAAASGGDPHWSNVILLVGAEAGLLDESPVGRTLIDSSNGARETGGGKFGSCSVAYNDGLLRYAQAADSPDWDFGTNPFTLEAWVQFFGNTSTFQYLLTHYDTNSQRSWALLYTPNTLQMFLSSNGGPATTVAQGSYTPTPSTWIHIVGEFDGTSYRTYANGVMIGKTTTTPINLHPSTAPFGIGHAFNTGALNSGFVGWLDEIRITKNVARYASDAGFTPPAAAFPRF